MRAQPLVLALALAGAAAADDSIVERWDKPRRESFDLKAVPPGKVVEEIRNRYKIPFSNAPLPVEPVDFAVTDVTFLEALDRLAAPLGLGFDGAPAGGGTDFDRRPLRLIQPSERRRTIPAVHVGPSRLSIQAVSVVAVRPVAESHDDVPLIEYSATDEAGLRLRLRWLVEPGFEDIAIVERKIAVIEDDLGRRLSLREQEDFTVPPNLDFALDFSPPSPGAKSIRKIEGTLLIALPIEKGKVSFLSSEAGQTKPLGAARVTLTSVDAEARKVAINVVGAPCAGVSGAYRPDLQVGTAGPHGGWSSNRLTMLPYDADGKPIAMGMTMESTRDDGTSSFKVELEAVPARIELEAVVRGAERELHFAFQDIPLPR